jgi:succinyl-diaminopimelate desuccinylase
VSVTAVTSEILDLAQALIARRSITPQDAGCQQVVAERLTRCGFSGTHLRFEEVDNLWITHGSGAPVFAFLGHTDVVPPGPVEAWQSDPFIPAVRDGHLYGRGAADMKGSVAAMVIALERFVKTHPQHHGTVALLLTSDEEGLAVNGTRRVVEHLHLNRVKIDWCLVGEPSSVERLGDTIKNGRRGSLTGVLTVQGVQGHVAYPERADNPVHRLAPALAELCAREWDKGNEHYPPTSFQVSNIDAGTGADNVIPGSLSMMFNFRHSTCLTREDLVRETTAILDRHLPRYRIDWQPHSLPFLTAGGRLLDGVRAAIRDATGQEPVASTGGGTSDGRFIAPTGAEIVELGPVNATIHKVNECVRVADLESLAALYERILVNTLGER